MYRALVRVNSEGLMLAKSALKLFMVANLHYQLSWQINTKLPGYKNDPNIHCCPIQWDEKIHSYSKLLKMG